MELPKIQVKFETSDGLITGSMYEEPKRVELEDDGSITVVVDYWPETPKVKTGL